LIYTIVLLFHLPFVMLLWPRIVWRKNWLFGLIPAGLAMILALIMNFMGTTQQSTEIQMPIQPTEAVQTGVGEEAEPIVPEVLEVSIPRLPNGPLVREDAPPMRNTVMITTALVVVMAVMLLAMQQRSQRRMMLLILLIGVGGIEVTFQIEEYLFRKDRVAIHDYVAGYVEKEGAFPDVEQFKSAGLDLTSNGARYRPGENAFSVFWDRPLSSGFAIVFSSDSNGVRIQD
jgi:hypothetical protein